MMSFSGGFCEPKRWRTSMRPGSETKRAVAGAGAGLLYGCVLAVLSLAAAGAGHGTPIPISVSSAPLGLFYSFSREATFFVMLFGAPLVWMVLGCLVALANRGAGLAMALLLLLLLHYLTALALLATTGATPRDIAGRIPEIFIVWALVYLAGQVALWWHIGRRRRFWPTV
jgi:hypothetical protein